MRFDAENGLREYHLKSVSRSKEREQKFSSGWLLAVGRGSELPLAISSRVGGCGSGDIALVVCRACAGRVPRCTAA